MGAAIKRYCLFSEIVILAYPGSSRIQHKR